MSRCCRCFCGFGRKGDRDIDGVSEEDLGAAPPAAGVGKKRNGRGCGKESRVRE